MLSFVVAPLAASVAGHIELHKQRAAERQQALSSCATDEERAALQACFDKEDTERTAERRHYELCQSIEVAGKKANFWSAFGQ